MNAIIFLIPISLVLAGVALVAFLWTLNARQYGDPEGDSHRILTAEDTPLVLKPASRVKE